jgi:hypothetical protein
VKDVSHEELRRKKIQKKTTFGCEVPNTSDQNIGKNKMFGGVRGPPLGPSGEAGNLAMWQAQGKGAGDNR